MTAFDGTDAARQLVPRWRSWRTTTALGECSSARVRHGDGPSFNKSTALQRYQARPNAGRAAELLAGALAYDVRDEDIASIAREYSDTKNEMFRELVVSACREAAPPTDSRAVPVDLGTPEGRITILKASVNRNPRNPIRWADLAREYTVLAQTKHARHAIRVALGLAPDNRFVLRCASALFVHREELDVARDILSRAPNLTSDPWILAPYVAICDLGDFKQYHHRTASRILEDAGLGLRDRAELAAALGTSELNAGGDRKGRQLLRRSAVDPTENSLAQVEWVSARTRSQLLEQAPPDVPHNFEALARRFQTDRKWQDAITSSASWLADQPFSSEAAAFGSFCSWVDEDWASTYNFAAAGFKANPADTMLKNNMALGRIETGEFADAISFLAKCRMMEAAPAERAVLCATEGLLFFRLGRTDEGRRRYERAISYFERHRVNSSAALAALMLAREEALTRSSAAPAALKVADSFIGEKPWPHLVTLRDRIGKLVSDPPHLLQAPHLRTDIARSLIELRGPSRLDAEEPVGDALAERATIS